MARKKDKKPIKIIEEKIFEQPITATLELNYMPYAMSVIVSRAIPEIDGFKPAHRKLLYTMYKMGLLNKARIKSANVVGQTMKLNPHGDASIYETMVRLTEGNGALLHPFVDSKGNFGKQYSRDMAYAAARYTEVKLSPICAEIFADIEKNTVEFVDNYDSSEKEPVLLPTTFPNILVNPNQGIAVGMASQICSFNLREVCEAAAAYIKNNNVNIIGIEKSGAFVDHAKEIADKMKPGQIFLMDNDHIYKYIMPADGNMEYARTSYYGGKFIYKSKEEKLYVLTLPVETHHYYSRPQLGDLKNIEEILLNIDLLKCDIYQDAIIPIALVNKLVSLSNYPGSNIIRHFTKQNISE